MTGIGPLIREIDEKFKKGSSFGSVKPMVSVNHVNGQIFQGYVACLEDLFDNIQTY